MIKSGTFLDQFFFNVDEKPLGGIPKVAQIGIVGNPDVGKSLLAQELSLRLASEGHKVVFTTSEDIFQSDNDRFDLQSRMKQKATVLGLNWENIKVNLFVLDIIAHSQLRDWDSLVSTYRLLVEQENAEFLIVDSLTLLDDYRAGLKYHLGEFVRYNQKHGITGIYISQKATEDAVDQHGLAGGIGLSHLLDVEFEINFKKVWSGDGQMKLDCDAKQGEILHFIRVLKCRLSKADMRYHRLEITKNGILSMVKVGQSL
jgi:KaiC/GvpD/RAD55 family RecA-like ATPase